MPICTFGKTVAYLGEVPQQHTPVDGGRGEDRLMGPSQAPADNSRNKRLLCGVWINDANSIPGHLARAKDQIILGAKRYHGKAKHPGKVGYVHDIS